MTVGGSPIVRPVKIRYPAFRRFNEARIDANNSMVGMLVGSRLSGHMLKAHSGARVLLPEIYPEVQGVDLLNRTVEDAQLQLERSEGHLATMALPFLQAVFEDFAESSADHLAARDHVKSPSERSQGLPGTLRFIERASGSFFSEEHRELFAFLRRVRNSIIHDGSRALPALDRLWATLPAPARQRWIGVTGRAYLSGGDAQGKILFQAPELILALAVTKQMAAEICGHLFQALVDPDWAEIILDDYTNNVRALTRRSTLVRELRSFARREYGPAAPGDAALRSVLNTRGLL